MPVPVSGPVLLLPVLALLGIGVAFAMYAYPPPSAAFALAAGIGLLIVLAIALVRYESAALLGFLLLGVVLVEPAPPDLVFAVVIALAVTTGRFDVGRVPVVIGSLLVLFLALNLLSVIEAADAGRALAFAIITLYLIVFGVWLAGFVRSVDRARLVVTGYLAAAVISAVLGSLALIVPFPGSETFLYEGVDRAKGLFADPNVFGPFLVPAALIVLQEAVEPRLLRFGRIWKVLLFAVLVVGVLLSFSRGAWLNLAVALVVMIGIFLVRRGGARRIPALVAVIAAAAIGATGAISLAGSEEFIEERTAAQPYDAERFAAQGAGVAQAGEYPLGIGPGQFENVNRYAAHSTYVRVLSEQGALGFFTLVALMLATLVLGASNAARGRTAFGIGSAALLAAWCGILANSVVVDTLHWRHLWMIAALIWVASMQPVERGTLTAAASRRPLGP